MTKTGEQMLRKAVERVRKRGAAVTVFAITEELEALAFAEWPRDWNWRLSRMGLTTRPIKYHPVVERAS